MARMDAVNNPGSDEAVRAGCKCPVMDNRRGRGLYTDDSGRVQFVVSEECPLHGAKGVQPDA